MTDNLRLLLVEDHSDTARLMQRLLAAHGFFVTVTTSVAEALQAGRDGTFDVVISDLGLPDGSGHRMMQELREIQPHIIGVAVTGFESSGDEKPADGIGFAAHLVKPLDLNQLLDTIRRVTKPRADS